VGINATSLRFNVTKDDEFGMEIHLKLNITGGKGGSFNANAYFFFRDGRPLRDFDNKYFTKTGFVSTSQRLTPEYESTEYDDIVLFIPYDQLHLNEESCQLKCHVEIQADGHILARSRDQYIDRDHDE
jgi:hypothetical protein